MNTALQLARLVAVLALICVAAAIATPKGRLPLALRGLVKLLARDRGRSIAVDDTRLQSVSGGKRTLAFLLVLLAILLSLI